MPEGLAAMIWKFINEDTSPYIVKKRGNGVFPQPGQVVFGECCWTCIAVSRMFVCCAVTGLALIMLTLPLSALHGRSRHRPGV